MNVTNTRKKNFDTGVYTMSEFSNSEKSYPGDSTEPIWKCRYVVTVIGFFLYLQTGIQETIMSVLIVAMVNNTAINQKSKAGAETCMDPLMNSTEYTISHGLNTEGEFNWSPQIQGYILGSYFFTNIISFIPSARLAERYGSKWFIVGTLLISGILIILIPPFSWLSPSAVIIIQTLRGFVLGFPIPCANILISNWSPTNERGFLFSFVMSGFVLGPVVGSIFAGYVSEFEGGWPYGCYIVGGSAIALGVYVLFFLAENPKDHPGISKAELSFILSHQEGTLSRKRPNLPWRQVLTCVPVYALIIAFFGRFWALSQFWIVHSTFLGTILHYPIGQNGLFSAMPNLVGFFSSQIAAWISLFIQKKNLVSVDFQRKCWTLISSLGFSLCLLGMYISGCNKDLSVIFAISSMGIFGLGTVGSMVVSQDMSPTFSGTLFSICCTAGTFPFAILPLLVGYLTDETRTLEQWNKVFFISIGVVMSSAIIFVIFGSAKIQSWNFVEESSEKEDDRKYVRRKRKEAVK